MNQGQAPTYSLVRFPDGNDRDALCEIAYTSKATPGAPNAME